MLNLDPILQNNLIYLKILAENQILKLSFIE